MAGVVKFTNPMYNPQVIEDIQSQIACLAFRGSIIVEYRDGRVSDVSYSASSERQVIDIARGFLRTNIEIVRVSIPRLNIVLR